MKKKQKRISIPSSLAKKTTIAAELSRADKKRRRIFGSIVAVLGFLLYSNTIGNGYVLDDFSAIKENNIVRQGLPAIKEIFHTTYRQGYLSIKDGLYRPLSLATFAAEWHFFPDQPSVSHFVNALLYAVTGYLLFLFLCELTLPQILSREKKLEGESFAFIASLLFIAHPLHTEVVANIKSRDEMLCFLFVISSFLCLFRFLNTGRKKFLWTSAGIYFLSLLSKETSITFLALLPLTLHLFRSVSIGKNMSITLFFAGTAAGYLLIRKQVLQGALADDMVAMSDNLLVAIKDTGTRIATAFYILGLYLKLHFFPHPLVYDNSYNQILAVHFSNWFALASLLIHLATGGFAAWMLRQSFGKKSNASMTFAPVMFTYGILWYLITIFLFSNLVLTIGTSYGERLLYFPSLGFCIVMGILLVLVGRKRSKENRDSSKISSFIPVKSFIFLLLILGLFSFKTVSRNADWKDNYTLYSHDVLISPNSVKAHYYLGLELTKVTAEQETDSVKRKKRYEEGLHELEKAVTIMPAFASAYAQIGVAYYRLKNYEKAIAAYEKSASLNPASALTQNNIGTVYFEWKKYNEAIKKFQQAVRIDPRYVDGYMNLGSVYGTLGQFDRAIESFLQAIKYSPDNSRAHFFLALTYENKGDFFNAQKHFSIAQQLDPKMKKQ